MKRPAFADVKDTKSAWSAKQKHIIKIINTKSMNILSILTFSQSSEKIYTGICSNC